MRAIFEWIRCVLPTNTAGGTQEWWDGAVRRGRGHPPVCLLSNCIPERVGAFFTCSGGAGRERGELKIHTSFVLIIHHIHFISYTNVMGV